MSGGSRLREWYPIGRRGIAVFAIVGLVGCRPPERARQEASRPAAAERAYPAQSFSARSLAEPQQQVTLEGFKGKVLLVDFWATWCPPCRHEIPILNRIYADYAGRGFELLGMTVDQGEWSAIAENVGKLNVRYPAVLADEAVQRAFGGIRVVPTKFLLDKEGNVRKSYQGVVPEEVLRSDIESLLAL